MIFSVAFVLVHAASDLITSLRYVSKEVIKADDANTETRPRKGIQRRSSIAWDLLEDESFKVRTLWKQLPSINLPFSFLLRWHLSLAHRRRTENYLMATIANSVPLQEFEWPSFLDKNRRLVKEPELRLRVFYSGLSPEMRANVWRHLLYVFPPRLNWEDRYTHLKGKKEEYFQLCDAWKSSMDALPTNMKSVMEGIRVDVIRTDRDRSAFADNNSQGTESLYNILVTFALTHLDISYSQGMNDVAAVFLEVYGGDEADAYICFNRYMELVPSLFQPRGFLLKISHFQALLHRYDSALFEHLELHDCQDLSFCFPWLLLNMKREVSHDDLLLLWDVMWSTLSPPQWYTKELSERQKLHKTSKSSEVEVAGGGGQRLEHSSHEVAGDWPTASQIEDGCAAEVTSPTVSLSKDSMPVRRGGEKGEEVSEQKLYGNPVVLFLAVAWVIEGRDYLMSVTPSEDLLLVYFSQQRGLYDIHKWLRRARTMMEDFVTSNDEPLE